MIVNDQISSCVCVWYSERFLRNFILDTCPGFWLRLIWKIFQLFRAFWNPKHPVWNGCLLKQTYISYTKDLETSDLKNIYEWLFGVTGSYIPVDWVEFFHQQHHTPFSRTRVPVWRWVVLEHCWSKGTRSEADCVIVSSNADDEK